MKPDDYRGAGGEEYERGPGGSSTILSVLPFLKGLPWDDFALSYVSTLRPSSIRVTPGEVHCDACAWRVTVYLRDDGRTIASVVQEVEVRTHGECQEMSGYDLGLELKRRVDPTEEYMATRARRKAAYDYQELFNKEHPMISKCFHECPWFTTGMEVMVCSHPKAPDTGYIIDHPECDTGFPARCPIREELIQSRKILIGAGLADDAG